MADYTSPHTGADIDRAVSIVLSNEFQQRIIFAHEITANDWNTLTGQDYKYSYNIILTGIYSTGEYPIVYFVGTDGVKYELDYTAVVPTGNARLTNVTIYSNIKIAGTVIEVASVSNNQQT